MEKRYKSIEFLAGEHAPLLDGTFGFVVAWGLFAKNPDYYTNKAIALGAVYWIRF